MQELDDGVQMSRDVVAHSMRYSFWRQIEPGLLAWAGEGEGEEKVVSFDKSLFDLVAWTKFKCHDASALALWSIAKDKQAGRLFDRFVLLTSWKESPQHRFIEPVHSYFLVRTKDSNVWYMGSPSNFTITRDIETFKIVSGGLDSIEDYLHNAPRACWGQWPTSHEIENVSRLSFFLRPSLRMDSGSPYFGTMRVFTINSGDKAGWGYEPVRLDFLRRTPLSEAPISSY
ncbi:MAG TPA: hypothetical protein VMR81_04795 [Patescibacteria group bacterium]|nr:hypothetical protein [Patescibacteria group bacterium]